MESLKKFIQDKIAELERQYSQPTIADLRDILAKIIELQNDKPQPTEPEKIHVPEPEIKQERVKAPVKKVPAKPIAKPVKKKKK